MSHRFPVALLPCSARQTARAFSVSSLPSPSLFPQFYPSFLPLALIATTDKETHSQRTGRRGGSAAGCGQRSRHRPLFPPLRSLLRNREIKANSLEKSVSRAKSFFHSQLRVWFSVFITPRLKGCFTARQHPGNKYSPKVGCVIELVRS